MKVIITGSDGFIGKNLSFYLSAIGHEVIKITKSSKSEDIVFAVKRAEFIFHLAGVNKTQSKKELEKGNIGFTKKILSILEDCDRRIPLIYSSTIQAIKNNDYGLSKKMTEDLIAERCLASNIPYQIYRLPNIFGKWCRPNYNSFIATFCHNISRNLPIDVHDGDATVELVYIDDLCNYFGKLLEEEIKSGILPLDLETYIVSVGEILGLINEYKNLPSSSFVLDFGSGLHRKLYATYLSYKPSSQYIHDLDIHGDDRGNFIEFVKNKDTGQVSFFSSLPGVTRGEHYHHTKNEKFLVIQGEALFQLRHLISNELISFKLSGNQPKIVESIPGWAHNITNTGESEMLVILWSNEVFDRSSPDTYTYKVNSK